MHIYNEYITIDQYIFFAEVYEFLYFPKRVRRGFFFWNETWNDPIGPFPSINFTRIYLQDYIEYLNQTQGGKL